jgi:hypothetical protein
MEISPETAEAGKGEERREDREMSRCRGIFMEGFW